MNKNKQRITAADLKRCDVAMMTVRKMAKLKQCKKYSSCGEYAADLLDNLERLKYRYAALVGVLLTNEPLPNKKILLRLVGEVNQMYAYAYPAPQAAEWRALILKPLTLTIERVDWQIDRNEKFMKS